MNKPLLVPFSGRKRTVVAKVFFIVLLLFPWFKSFSQINPGLNRITVSIGGGRIDSALLDIPWDYNQAAKSYPLLIFLHGIGARGNNLNLLLNDAGIPQLTSQGKAPFGIVNGDTTRFIVLSPQDQWHSFSVYPAEVHSAIQDLLGRGYKIDSNRIYLTGLSAGGGMVIQYLNDYPGDPVSAVVPMSPAGPGVPLDVSPYKNAYMWALSGSSDPLTNNATTEVDAINKVYPGHARMTIYPGGHCCWNTYYDPAYRENINGKMMNIYEWMLQYSFNGAPPPPPPVNLPPVANAGSNISITLPADSTVLDGSASKDPDGTIQSYSWSQVSGPSQFTLSGSNAAKAMLNNLVAGTYIFSLTVTDNLGATASGNVTITVSPAVNLPPVANAGSNISITLPVDSTVLDGSASKDPDGTIQSYSWSQVSGPSPGNIVNSAGASTLVNKLMAGIYTFSLTVTDNQGATGKATVLVTVIAPVVLPVPIANAGSDTTITLPANTVLLNGGNSSELNGKITGYQWAEISGPSQYLINTPNAVQTTVSNLVAGRYVFGLTVKDSIGTTASAQVTITVNSALKKPHKKIYLSSPDSAIAYDMVNSNLNISAGDTICISAGTYKYIRLGGMVGAKDTPIVIQNCGGVVKIGVNDQKPYAFIIDSSQYFEINGSGTPGIEYGFEIVGTSDALGGQRATGLILNNRCSDFDVHNLYIHDILAQGIVSLTYGLCNDPRTWRQNFVQKNTKYHHIKIINVGLEGFYLGRTFPTQEVTPCGDTINNPLLENVSIYDNIVNNTGKGGIQLSLAFLGTNKIYNNEVTKWGYMNYPGGYNVGISVGEGTKADVFNNIVHDGPGIGLQLLGSGLTRIYNNIFYNINVNASDAIQSGDRFDVGPYTLYVFNNTFVNIARLAINVYGSNSTTDNLFFNNYMVHCDTPATAAPFKGISTPNWWLPSSILYQQSNNIYIDTVADAKFVNPASGDFHLLPGSPAIDKGKDLSQYGIINDFDEARRPVGAGYDIGAFEYGTSLSNTNKNPVANAGPDTTIVLPENTVSLDGGSSFDPDGNIAAYKWTEVSGPSQAVITNAAATVATVSNLATAGTYIFQLNVTDNKGASSSDLVTVLVKTAAQTGPPVAVTGKDITLTLPKNTADLDGNASYDPGGVIISYKWVKISGPSQYSFDAHYHNYLSLCTVNNLAAGTYVFQLTVTDTRGYTSTATQKITVLGSSQQAPPVANAGTGVTITLPVDSTMLDGSNSTAPGGTIASYGWSQLSGPSQANIVSSAAAKTEVNKLVAGVYVFQLTVTDNQGATSSDQVSITVDPAIVGGQQNQPPVANAGKDITLISPANSVSLDGSGSYDPDGKIAGYSWQLISGSGQATITGADSPHPLVSNLTPGKYIIQLTVTDDKGALASATVTVTVSSINNGVKKGNGVLVYPNPATATLNVEINNNVQGALIIDFFDVSGRLVKAFQFTKDQQSFFRSLDISGFTSGVYFMQVLLSNLSITKKIIKQ